MTDKMPRRGPVRDTMEALGMAILMAVLLKYFVIEAYVIPTPSMQPTMMGSPEAGLRDRILVDKIYYTICEPKRWDIAVFRYPLKQLQSYVKRIVGVPNDRLRILGGNIYQVQSDGSLVVERKPDSVQEGLWKEVFPLRRELDRLESGTAPKLMKNYFFGTAWREESEGLVASNPKGASGELRFNGPRGGLLANRISDGYEPAVGREISKQESMSPESGKYGVTDVRLSLDLNPEQVPDRVMLVVEAQGSFSYALILSKGKGRLVVGRTLPNREFQEITSGEAFDYKLETGGRTRLSFAHVDDELIAWRNGDIAQRFDCKDHRITDDVTPRQAKAKLAVTSKGRVRVQDIFIERDLHYTRSNGDIGKDQVIEIPEGHYFLMGDNTLGSEDSRAWRSLTIGVTDDGHIVDPKDPQSKRTLVGNRRPNDVRELPRADDNPIPARDADGTLAVVGFIDELGQVHRLYADVDPDQWGIAKNESLSCSFLVKKAGQTTTFGPDVAPVSFVPRAHIQGRPLLNFFRSFRHHFYRRWIR